MGSCTPSLAEHLPYKIAKLHEGDAEQFVPLALARIVLV
jgi:hypothetical protein